MAISYIGQTNTTTAGTRGTSLSLTPHGSTQVGDVVIATFASENNATFTPGSGFTLLKKTSTVSNQTGLGIYYKVMASTGDITSYTFSCSTSSHLALGMITVSGFDLNAMSFLLQTESASKVDALSVDPFIWVPTTGCVNFLISASDTGATVSQPANWTELFDISSTSIGDDVVLSAAINSSISAGGNNPSSPLFSSSGYLAVCSLTLVPTDATYPTDVPYLWGVNLSSGTDNVQISLPSHQADDLLLILVSGRANSPIWSNETGWTKVVHPSGGFHSTLNFIHGIYYQIATSSSTSDFLLDVNADLLYAEIFVIRNVDVDKFTKGIASTSYEHKLTLNGTVPTYQVNPEFDKSLVIEYIFSGLDSSTFSNANWTDIRYHPNYGTVDGAGQVGVRTLTTNAQVQGYSVTGNSQNFHIHALRFYFAAPGATMYPTLRWIKNETTSPVQFYINEYQRYFWKEGAMVMMVVDHDFDDASDQGLTSPVSNPRHSYGAVSTYDSYETEHGMFMQTYVPSTSSLAGAVFSYTSSTPTETRSLYQIVGVDTTNPISDFQSLNTSSSADTGISSIPFKAKTLYPGCNHIIMARGSPSPITGLQTPSGYTDYRDDNAGLITFNKVTDPGNISTAVTATGEMTEHNWCAFVLNPYGIPSTKKRPTIRSRVIRTSKNTTAHTIYTAPLKAGDVVVFFSATKITTSQITLTSSLGTLTNLYAVNDDTNKWNASIDAIKIASAVTTSWTITCPTDTGTSLKFIVGVVFENTTIENVSSIIKASATSSTTVSSHDLTFTDNAAVGYTVASYAYSSVRNANNSDAGPVTSNYGYYNSGAYYGQVAAFDNPIPTALTETITYPQGALKSFLMGVRLSGYGASDAGFFFGTPF